MLRRNELQVQRLAIGVLVCCVIALLPKPATAATFCVSTAAELVSALSTAQTNGEADVIQVVQGLYQGTFAYESHESYGLTIEGGYVAGCGSRVVNPSNTMLDGMRSGTVLSLSSFVNATSDYAVDGLTLQKGETSGDGGGLFALLEGGNLTVTNTIISDNSATTGGVSHGGGVSWGGTGIFTLINNTISNNTAWLGGGVFNGSILINNTITNNIAAYAGGVSRATILANNTICDNTADGTGGGVEMYGGEQDPAILDSNTICNNTAIHGGGVAIYDGNVTLINNSIIGNSAFGDGGGIQIADSVFSGQETSNQWC